MLPNIPAFPLAMLGIVRAGAVQVNVNPLYTPRELEHQLNDAGVEIIVIFSGVTPTLAEIIGKTTVKHVISVEPGDGIGASFRARRWTRGLQRHRLLRRPHAGADFAFTPVRCAATIFLFLQYTGGTTGLSKGAALSHRNLVANTEQFKAFMPGRVAPGRGSRGHGAAALSHLRADGEFHHLLFHRRRELAGSQSARYRRLLRDSAQVALHGFHRREHAVRRADMHPKIGEVDFSSLRVAIGGGAAVLPTTSAKWKALTGKDILEGYGLSETSPILTLNPMTREAFSATVGLPLPSTDIKLLDGDDKEAALGEAGRDLRQGPAGDEGLLAEAGSQCGRIHGRRLFPHRRHRRVRREGLPRIVDRKKDMIIVSGFNVYPNEVEAVAAACAGVAECACVGRPDEKTGEAVRLFVAKAPGASFTEADVIAHCRRELAAYKVPKDVRFLDALPKSNVGKILRKDLRAAEQGSTMASRTTAWRRPPSSSAANSASRLGRGRPRTASISLRHAPATGSGSTSISSAPGAKARSAVPSRTATSRCRWSPPW